MKNSAEIKQVWSKHKFGNGVHYQEKKIFDFIIKLCSGGKKVILDIGIGDGRMPRNILDQCKPKIFGIDLTFRVKQASVPCVVGDCRKLPFQNNFFDIVYSLGVVEHFPETKEAIAEHIRVLKPGGHLFFTTPHFSAATFYKIYQYLFKAQWRLGTFEVVRGRNLTLESVKEMIKEFPIELLFLEGCGIRRETKKTHYFIKKFLPENWLHAHLIVGAVKKHASK